MIVRKAVRGKVTIRVLGYVVILITGYLYSPIVNATLDECQTVWKCSCGEGEMIFPVDIDMRRLETNSETTNYESGNSSGLKENVIWIGSGENASHCQCHCGSSPSGWDSVVTAQGNAISSQPTFVQSADVTISKGFILPSQAPTQLPTSSPSEVLNVKGASPTYFPSSNPTALPTPEAITQIGVPTSTPSSITLSPSMYPSVNPSTKPTFFPSHKPSILPTVLGSTWPSQSPSKCTPTDVQSMYFSTRYDKNVVCRWVCEVREHVVVKESSPSHSMNYSSSRRLQQLHHDYHNLYNIPRKSMSHRERKMIYSTHQHSIDGFSDASQSSYNSDPIEHCVYTCGPDPCANESTTNHLKQSYSNSFQYEPSDSSKSSRSRSNLSSKATSSFIVPSKESTSHSSDQKLSMRINSKSSNNAAILNSPMEDAFEKIQDQIPKSQARIHLPQSIKLATIFCIASSLILV